MSYGPTRVIPALMNASVGHQIWFVKFNITMPLICNLKSHIYWPFQVHIRACFLQTFQLHILNYVWLLGQFKNLFSLTFRFFFVKCLAKVPQIKEIIWHIQKKLLLNALPHIFWWGSYLQLMNRGLSCIFWKQLKNNNSLHNEWMNSWLSVACVCGERGMHMCICFLYVCMVCIWVCGMCICVWYVYVCVCVYAFTCVYSVCVHVH